MPVPGPLKPLVAIPTTAGTGSETAGVAIFDFVKMHATTTTLPFHQRQRPERPILRPAYQGSNHISDVWSLESLWLLSIYLECAVRDSFDDEARASMKLAAAYAGIGFGNSGVHLPHGMSYPVSGLVRDYRAPGYAVDHALVPHGVSVILNAPTVYRFVASACPERHLRAAEILGAEVNGAHLDDAGKILADRIVQLMANLHLSKGLRAPGYETADIPRLVEGTLPQHRVTQLSPRPAGTEDLREGCCETLIEECPAFPPP